MTTTDVRMALPMPRDARSLHVECCRSACPCAA